MVGTCCVGGMSKSRANRAAVRRRSPTRRGIRPQGAASWISLASESGKGIIETDDTESTKSTITNTQLVHAAVLEAHLQRRSVKGSFRKLSALVHARMADELRELRR